RVGTSHFIPKELKEQETRQIVGSGDFYWRLGSRVSMHTLVDRDLDFSVYGDNLYFRQDHGGVEWLVFLNRYLGLTPGYDGYRLSYPLVIGPRGERPDLLFGDHREDDIRRISGGFRFQITRKAALTVRVASRTRTSNLPGADDHQVLVTSGVETAF